MSANKSRLAGLTKDLTSKWAQTKDSWADAKSREFEQLYMDELIAGVNRAVNALAELEKVMSKIRKDCE